MSFTQLNPPIPIEVIGKGKALAFAVIDYGPEHNLMWVSAIDCSGEIWCAPNPVVRMQANWSLGRPHAKAHAPDPCCGQSSDTLCADLLAAH